MEIAVFVGPDGETAAIHEVGEIRVYKYAGHIWEMCRSMPFSLQSIQGLPAGREYMQIVIGFLGKCRIFVGRSVSGLPFFELEKAGFTVWEKADSPLHFLDSIRDAEAEGEFKPARPEIDIIVPQPELREVSPGCYAISLKDIQNCNGKVTSKQILVPLLEKMAFETLVVVCSHVPPWLELKVQCGEIDGEIYKIDANEARVVISR